ncbi:Stress response protein NST1 [Balamuthia mandrillaris]
MKRSRAVYERERRAKKKREREEKEAEEKRLRETEEIRRKRAAEAQRRPVDLFTASTNAEQSEEGIASSEKEKTTADLSVPKVTTIEEVNKLRGRALAVQIALYGLKKRYNGDNTVEGQKKRLAAYITDPSVHFLTAAKQRELSELGLCRN